MRHLSRIPTQPQDSMSMDTRALTHMQIHTLMSIHMKRRKKRISKGKYLFRKRRRRMNVSTLVFIRQPTQVSVRVKEKDATEDETYAAASELSRISFICITNLFQPCYKNVLLKQALYSTPLLHQKSSNISPHTFRGWAHWAVLGPSIQQHTEKKITALLDPNFPASKCKWFRHKCAAFLDTIVIRSIKKDKRNRRVQDGLRVSFLGGC